ncbi:expansin-B18-like [Rhododendron vialii]|uniref:expansin-B18-like n=1 Tax=Rhododendron vialii TaxID=182163 RepID=UPI00265ECDFB|nr:expansin-B18-like [Rhododendron vialii]
MATNNAYHLPHLFVSCLLTLFCFCEFCFCFHPKQVMNLSTAADEWSLAGATWYGSPDGAESDGGACGYGDAVLKPPFNSMITAISPSLYKSGKGCGVCYQVKCTTNPSCSGNPVRVVVTDLCPGGPCVPESIHFDLSGTAFGALAKPGEEDKLRGAGVLQIDHARVPCDYAGTTIAFRVDPGSNPCYFAVAPQFEEGDGDLASVDLKEATSATAGPDEWKPMQQSWGAVWKLESGSALQAPFSIRLTSGNTGRILVANDVIPAGWQPGAIYPSLVNYL